MRSAVVGPHLGGHAHEHLHDGGLQLGNGHAEVSAAGRKKEKAQLFN